MLNLASLERLPDWIHIRDRELQVVWSTSASRSVFDWNASAAKTEQTQAAERAAKSCVRDGSWTGRLERVDRSGNTRRLTSHWSVLPDEKGEPIGFYVFEEDVATASLANDQLLRAQRMESIATLAGGVAHDMNNVLGPILMASELIRKRVDDPWIHEKLHGIETSARRGADNIKQVLDFSRGIEGEKIAVQIRHLLKELLAFAEHTFAKSIHIEGAFPRDLPPVLGDAAQLRQAVLNLMVNARDAMPGGGELRLKASDVFLDAATAAGLSPHGIEGGYVRIDVEDTGQGMEPEMVERIFEPFFTTKARGRGTGMGLSTTLSIAQGHGGFMAVDSTSGKGSVFSIFLPKADQPAASTHPGEEPIPEAGGGQHILVVDDEPMMLEMNLRMLEIMGFKATGATNGQEGLDLFLPDPRAFDLVVTDINMPVMDGPTMIREMRARRPDFPVVAISGLSESIHAREGTGLGGIQILHKPYSIDELLRVVHQKLGTEGQVQDSGSGKDAQKADRPHTGETLSDNEFDQLMGGDW